MDQPAGNKAIILVAHTDGRGPENQGIHQPGIIKSEEGDNGGKYNNDRSDRIHQEILIKDNVIRFTHDDIFHSSGWCMHGTIALPARVLPIDEEG
jgi:hypothetical protein